MRGIPTDAQKASTRARQLDRPPTLTALTGLRAIAAAWVVLYHLREGLYTLLPATRVAEPWLGRGYLGVDVFFVLSGFIISYNYAERLATLDRRRYRDFMAARFARIYPVYLLGLLLTAALVGLAAIVGTTLNPLVDYTAVGFLGNVLMLHAFPGVEPWNVASWSVACEMAAYLVFPLAAGALLRIGRRRALILCAAVVVVELGLIASLRFSPVVIYPLFWTRIAAEFALGCLLWAAWRQGSGPRRGWDVVTLAAVGVGCACLAVVPNGLASFVVVPFLALAVVAVAGTAGIVRAGLSSRLAVWGGRVSYSLYLTHEPVYTFLARVSPPSTLAAAPLVTRVGAVVVYLLVALLLAAAVYHLVEEPARAWLRRRIDGRRSHDVGVAAAAERAAGADRYIRTP